MPIRSPTADPDSESGMPFAVFCDTDAPPHVERFGNPASLVTVRIDGRNVSIPDGPFATERFSVPPEFDPSQRPLSCEFGEFFSIYDPGPPAEGRIHLYAFWNLLDSFVANNVMSPGEAPEYWYEALKSSRDNTPCACLLEFLLERGIPFSIEQNNAYEEIPESARDLMRNASMIPGSGYVSVSVSNGPFQDRGSKVRSRPEITDAIIDIFKEEGLNAEETRMALTAMLNDGEISVKSLREDGPLFRYGDDRRYIANRALNKVFEFRRKEREMKKRCSDANRGSFDPSIDIMTGRPVGCL